MECRSCGANLDPRDKICGKCGAVTSAGQGTSELFGHMAGDAFSYLGKLGSIAATKMAASENRRFVGLGVIILAVLLLALTQNPISERLSHLSSPKNASAAQQQLTGVELARFEVEAIEDPRTYQTINQAEVREYPTSRGGAVTDAIGAGTSLVAREVSSIDPTSRWFQIDGGGYVWGGNFAGVDHAETVPVDLRGEWSTFASCLGQGQDAKLRLSARSAMVSSSSYVYEGKSATFGGYPVFGFSDRDLVSPGPPLTISEDNASPYIWIVFGEDLGGAQTRYFRSTNSCRSVRALLRN